MKDEGYLKELLDMQKEKSRRKYAVVGGVVLLLAAAVLLLTGMRNREESEALSGETASAFIGDLSARATASGTLLPSRSSSLSTDMPGRVEKVAVQAGDRVQAGDELVRLETDDLALNVTQNEQNLKLKEASLADLLAGAGQAQIASAEAAVASAQAQLDDLLSEPSAEEMATLEAELNSAEANTWSSSAQLRQTQNGVKAADIAAAEAGLVSARANLTSVEIQYSRNPSPDDIQANTALAQARQQVNSAQAQLDALLAGPDANQLGSAQAGLSAAKAQQDAAEIRYNQQLSGPNAAEVAGAEAQLEQAKANLAELADGPTDEEIAAAEAEVAQARVNLADAQAALETATIKAPFAGVVTAVHYAEGEYASGPTVSMFADDSLEVILEVDEADIAALRVGQAATVSLEAFPSTPLNGEITVIAPKAAQSPGSSLVVYEVHLALDETALPLRSGMTADADLVVAKREDVLLVPNQAINADRAAGTYSVNLIVGETVEETPVIIGQRDGQHTQIVDGLNPGDELLIGNEIPVDSSIPEPGDRGPFGG
ncbi:MAG: efflux RND transporter periplasmic adaptor subunit [Chloroflexota bacterium]|nr:MAG: efflux RND transporter periplasmic adaptor subunit [Chloroflexota bacterium]